MLNLPLFLCSLATVTALERAIFVPQSDISKRAIYNGGWALGLAGSSCPSDAPVACDTGSGSVNPMCCPSGQTCSGNIRPYCCPSSVDCVNVVQNVPVCANSSWNMYTQGGGNYFCCEPGQYGVLPLHGYAGICEPLDQAVASSLIATPASQAGGPAVTSVAGQTGGTAASTLRVTSTLQGGGVTTITTAVSGAAATATATSTSAGGLPSTSNGGGTATITLSKGAEIGIAVAAGIIAIIAAILIWRCLRSRNRKAIKMNSAGYGFPPQTANGQNQSHGLGPAPMYSATPHPQQMGMAQGAGQQPYVVSPIQEYKTPMVGVVPQGGQWGVPSPRPSPPPPGSAGAFTPPPQHQHQGQYMPSPVSGRFEAPGAPVAAPVEAPNVWERGL